MRSTLRGSAGTTPRLVLRTLATRRKHLEIFGLSLVSRLPVATLRFRQSCVYERCTPIVGGIDLSPGSHPGKCRADRSFEPCRLDVATGRGA